MIRIGFRQRVYEARVTPVYRPDKAVIVKEVKDLDWKFRISYMAWSADANDVKDTAATYRLEFIP